MAKIICPNAEIQQKLCERIGPYKAIACTGDCPTCHGEGWYEAEVVEVEKVKELIRGEIEESFKADGYSEMYAAGRVGSLNYLSLMLDSLKEAK